MACYPPPPSLTVSPWYDLGIKAKLPRAVLKGETKKVRNANRNEGSRGRSLLHGPGTFSTSKVGGWWLVAVGGWWRLAVGSWWSLGALLTGCSQQKNKSGFLKTALQLPGYTASMLSAVPSGSFSHIRGGISDRAGRRPVHKELGIPHTRACPSPEGRAAGTGAA